MTEPRKTKRVESEDAGTEKPGGRGGVSYLLMMLIFALLLFFGWQTFFPSSRTTVDFSFFLEQVRAKNVQWASVNGYTINGKWKNVVEARKDWTSYLKEKKNASDAEADGSKVKATKSPELAEEFTTEAPSFMGERLATILDENQV